MQQKEKIIGTNIKTEIKLFHFAKDMLHVYKIQDTSEMERAIDTYEFLKYLVIGITLW